MIIMRIFGFILIALASHATVRIVKEDWPHLKFETVFPILILIIGICIEFDEDICTKLF